MANRYRKRPNEVEAVLWTGENWDEVKETFEFDREIFHDEASYSLFVHTYDGRIRCAAGDWLIRKVETGEYWAYKQKEFEAEFELINVLQDV